MGCHECNGVSALDLVVRHMQVCYKRCGRLREEDVPVWWGGAGISVLVYKQRDRIGVFQQTHMFSNRIYLPRVDCSRIAAAFHLSI